MRADRRHRIELTRVTKRGYYSADMPGEPLRAQLQLHRAGAEKNGQVARVFELLPHDIFISGGTVTPTKLFVNNSNGRIGLMGSWDRVAFDARARVGGPIPTSWLS